MEAFPAPKGIRMFSINCCTRSGGAGVNFEIIMEIVKLTNIATVPNPSGEIPNYQSFFVPAPNQPNLNLVI